ncbi:hypothetical protein [Rhodophyticola sp.]|jgi:hypothetical protein|uniref:hypothetical protein n=1 Tax=Rhodophyticola sp. TaxID=2680032 RepID=UPI003D28FF27
MKDMHRLNHLTGCNSKLQPVFCISGLGAIMVVKTSSYGAARGVLGFAELALWCGIGLGVIIAIVAGGAASRGFGSSGLLAAVPGISMAIFCFVGVVLVQMGKAAVDTADYSFQMLGVARQQLDVSKQALAHASRPTSFADQPSANPNSTSSRAPDSRQSAETPAPPTKALPGASRGPVTGRRDWDYRGMRIHKNDLGFLVEGHTFATLDQAKSHVDQDAARATTTSSTKGTS